MKKNAFIESRLRGDIAGGLTSAVITLPVALACGVLVFAPLGSDFTAFGVRASLYGAVIASIVAVLLGSTPSQITGPKLSIAVILTALAADLMQKPYIVNGTNVDLSLVVSIMFSAILLSGILQLLFGLFRIGHLIKYIPYSVITGYVTGVAILIIISQLGNFFGLQNPHFLAQPADSIQSMQLATTLVSVATMAVLICLPRFFPKIPASFPALVLGTLLHLVLRAYLGNAGIGPTIGAIPQGLPTITEFVWSPNFATAMDYREYLLIIAPPALSMAVLGAMASLLGVLLVEASTKNRYNGNRELIGLGTGNIISSFCGGLVSAGSTSRTLVNIEAGSSTKISGVVHGLCLFLVVTILGPLVGLIPLSVIAALLMTASFRMMKTAVKELGWKKTRQAQYRRELFVNLSVMLVVTIVAVFYDLIIALVAGLVLASILFIATESRRIIKRIYHGDMVHSKTIRNALLTNALKKQGKKIAVIEVEGVLFFGSTESLFQKIESILPQSTCIILDLLRVRHIDSNGARFILMLHSYVKKKNKYLLISHVSSRNFLGFFHEMHIIEAIGQGCFFPDTDAALAWAEDFLLAAEIDIKSVPEEIPLEQFDVLQGFDRKQLNILEQKLKRFSFNKGDHIVKEGDRERSVYLLASGSVSVMIQIPGEKKKKRISTFSPGVVFGELALLEGTPRSADIVADEESICYRLDVDDFQELTAGHHDVAVQLAINISRILAQRLLSLTDELRVLEQ